jgi:hypothetical protein
MFDRIQECINHDGNICSGQAGSFGYFLNQICLGHFILPQ